MTSCNPTECLKNSPDVILSPKIGSADPTKKEDDVDSLHGANGDHLTYQSDGSKGIDMVDVISLSSETSPVFQTQEQTSIKHDDSRPATKGLKAAADEEEENDAEHTDEDILGMWLKPSTVSQSAGLGRSAQKNEFSSPAPMVWSSNVHARGRSVQSGRKRSRSEFLGQEHEAGMPNSKREFSRIVEDAREPPTEERRDETHSKDSACSILHQLDLSPHPEPFLQYCVRAYTRNFEPTFPFLHTNTIRSSKTLLPVIAAVGCHSLSPPKLLEQGQSLLEQVRRSIMAEFERTVRGTPKMVVRLIQAAVLVQCIALFSPIQTQISEAYILHTKIVACAQRFGLFETKHPRKSGSNNPSVKQTDEWNKWCATEETIRTVLMLYILDSEFLASHGQKRVLDRDLLKEMQASSDAIFESSSLESWASLYHQKLASDQSCLTAYAKLGGIAAAISEAWINNVLSSQRANRFEARLCDLLIELVGDDAGESMPNPGLNLLWHAAFISLYTPFKLLEKVSSPGLECLSEEEQQHLQQWSKSTAGQRSILHALAIKQILAGPPFIQVLPLHLSQAAVTAGLCFFCFIKYGSFPVDDLARADFTSIDYPELELIDFDAALHVAELDLVAETGRPMPIAYSSSLQDMLAILQSGHFSATLSNSVSRLRLAVDREPEETFPESLFEFPTAEQPVANQSEIRADVRPPSQLNAHHLVDDDDNDNSSIGSTDLTDRMSGLICRRCWQRSRPPHSCGFIPGRTSCKPCIKAGNRCDPNLAGARRFSSRLRYNSSRRPRVDEDKAQLETADIVGSFTTQDKLRAKKQSDLHHAATRQKGEQPNEDFPTCTECFDASNPCKKLWRQKCDRCIELGLQCKKRLRSPMPTSAQGPLRPDSGRNTRKRRKVWSKRSKKVKPQRHSCRRCLQRSRECLRSRGPSAPCDYCCVENRYCYENLNGLQIDDDPPETYKSPASKQIHSATEREDGEDSLDATDSEEILSEGRVKTTRVHFSDKPYTGLNAWQIARPSERTASWSSSSKTMSETDDFTLRTDKSPPVRIPRESVPSQHGPCRRCYYNHLNCIRDDGPDEPCRKCVLRGHNCNPDLSGVKPYQRRSQKPRSYRKNDTRNQSGRWKSQSAQRGPDRVQTGPYDDEGAEADDDDDDDDVDDDDGDDNNDFEDGHNLRVVPGKSNLHRQQASGRSARSTFRSNSVAAKSSMELMEKDRYILDHPNMDPLVFWSVWLPKGKPAPDRCPPEARPCRRCFYEGHYCYKSRGQDGRCDSCFSKGGCYADFAGVIPWRYKRAKEHEKQGLLVPNERNKLEAHYERVRELSAALASAPETTASSDRAPIQNNMASQTASGQSDPLYIYREYLPRRSKVNKHGQNPEARPCRNCFYMGRNCYKTQGQDQKCDRCITMNSLCKQDLEGLLPYKYTLAHGSAKQAQKAQQLDPEADYLSICTTSEGGALDEAELDEAERIWSSTSEEGEEDEEVVMNGDDIGLTTLALYQANPPRTQKGELGELVPCRRCLKERLCCQRLNGPDAPCNLCTHRLLAGIPSRCSSDLRGATPCPSKYGRESVKGGERQAALRASRNKMLSRQQARTAPEKVSGAMSKISGAAQEHPDDKPETDDSIIARLFDGNADDTGWKLLQIYFRNRRKHRPREPTECLPERIPCRRCLQLRLNCVMVDGPSAPCQACQRSPKPLGCGRNLQGATAWKGVYDHLVPAELTHDTSSHSSALRQPGTTQLSPDQQGTIGQANEDVEVEDLDKDEDNSNGGRSIDSRSEWDDDLQWLLLG